MFKLKLDTPDDDLYAMVLRVLKTEGIRPKTKNEKECSFSFVTLSEAEYAQKILSHYGIQTTIGE